MCPLSYGGQLFPPHIFKGPFFPLPPCMHRVHTGVPSFLAIPGSCVCQPCAATVQVLLPPPPPPFLPCLLVSAFQPLPNCWVSTTRFPPPLQPTRDYPNAAFLDIRIYHRSPDMITVANSPSPRPVLRMPRSRPPCFSIPCDNQMFSEHTKSYRLEPLSPFPPLPFDALPLSRSIKLAPSPQKLTSSPRAFSQPVPVGGRLSLIDPREFLPSRLGLRQCCSITGQHHQPLSLFFFIARVLRRFFRKDHFPPSGPYSLLEKLRSHLTPRPSSLPPLTLLKTLTKMRPFSGENSRSKDRNHPLAFWHLSPLTPWRSSFVLNPLGIQDNFAGEAEWRSCRLFPPFWVPSSRFFLFSSCLYPLCANSLVFP